MITAEKYFGQWFDCQLPNRRIRQSRLRNHRRLQRQVRRVPLQDPLLQIQISVPVGLPTSE